MANISGKDGKVTRQVTGVDTIIAGIREWNLTLTGDQHDVTEFAETPPTNHNYLIALKDWTATIIGNHTDAVPVLDNGTEYSFDFVVVSTAGSEVSYFGTAKVQSTQPATTVTGEAVISYTVTGTGKLYVLGANVVVDGGFTAASSAAWVVTDPDVSYDTTNDQIDWDGDGDLTPTANNVIVSAATYWTQMLIENESGTSSLQLKLGTTAGTARSSDGTYTQYIVANNTTFTVVGLSNDAISLSEIIIRRVYNP